MAKSSSSFLDIAKKSRDTKNTNTNTRKPTPKPMVSTPAFPSEVKPQLGREVTQEEIEILRQSGIEIPDCHVTRYKDVKVPLYTTERQEIREEVPLVWKLECPESEHQHGNQPPMNQPMPGYPMPTQPMPGYPMPTQPMPGYPMPTQPAPGYPLPGQPMPTQPMPTQPISWGVRGIGFESNISVAADVNPVYYNQEIDLTATVTVKNWQSEAQGTVIFYAKGVSGQAAQQGSQNQTPQTQEQQQAANIFGVNKGFPIGQAELDEQGNANFQINSGTFLPGRYHIIARYLGASPYFQPSESAEYPIDVVLGLGSLPNQPGMPGMPNQPGMPGMPGMPMPGQGQSNLLQLYFLLQSQADEDGKIELNQLLTLLPALLDQGSLTIDKFLLLQSQADEDGKIELNQLLTLLPALLGQGGGDFQQILMLQALQGGDSSNLGQLAPLLLGGMGGDMQNNFALLSLLGQNGDNGNLSSILPLILQGGMGGAGGMMGGSLSSILPLLLNNNTSNSTKKNKTKTVTPDADARYIDADEDGNCPAGTTRELHECVKCKVEDCVDCSDLTPWETLNPINGWRNATSVNNSENFGVLEMKCLGSETELSGVVTGRGSNRTDTLQSPNSSSIVAIIPERCAPSKIRFITVHGFTSSGQIASVKGSVVPQDDGTGAIFLQEEGLDPDGNFWFDQAKFRK